MKPTPKKTKPPVPEKKPSAIQNLARRHAKAALAALVAVFDDPEASPAARVSAAMAILNWGYGKPGPAADADKDPALPATARTPPLVRLIWADPDLPSRTGQPPVDAAPMPAAD